MVRSRVEYDFAVPVLLTLDVTVGDLARYSAIDPFFEILEADDPSESLYRIDDGAEVVFELVAIDPAIGVRINGVNLLQAGSTVVIGTMPDLHADPEWQLTLPVGEVAAGSWPSGSSPRPRNTARRRRTP